MNTTTTPAPAWPTDPHAALGALLSQLTATDSPALAAVSRLVSVAAGSSAQGTLRDWMRAHDGVRVDTLQVGLGRRSAWAPTARVVDASRTTFATLDGSRRDYAGMRVVAANDDGIMVADESHVVVYAVTD